MGQLSAVAAPETPAAPPAGSRRLLGMRVDAGSYASACQRILAMAERGGGMTCVATVHMVMEAFDDPAFQRIVNAAELVTSDGMPLVWALRALGLRDAERVYGPDLTPLVCEGAARRGLPVGFVGGSPALLARLAARLGERFPDLEIAFSFAPPFGPAPERPDPDLVRAVESSGAKLLFVGLGCPKQERWMAAYREALPCALVGVGAAFDFLAGAKPVAPDWMKRAGLEWLFRLACEPRRLARRYLWHNPRFAARMAWQIARERGRMAWRLARGRGRRAG